jgi:plastocyanin/mono/diheme cytochrome c family protein
MRFFRDAVITIAVLVIVVLVVVYAMVARGGLSAEERPGAIERSIARRLVRLSIPADARQQTNPFAAKSDSWREAAGHFQDHCAVCHGADGHGRTDIGQYMYPQVPDLTEPAVQQMTDGDLFYIIQNGVRWTGMPAFRSSHSPDEIWQLVSFVRHVPRLPAVSASTPSHHDEPGTQTPQGRTVAMDGTSFVPAEIRVQAGETVTWINRDPFPHTVASRTGRFRSGELAADAHWQFTPAAPGRFEYVCTLHPGMRGTLIVEQKSPHRRSME